MLTWITHRGRTRVQPERGDYSDWKPKIAADCGQQCTYCCISVARGGGIDNFHVDHFRPKSRFSELQKTIENLFLACAICNRFKSDKWPRDPLPDHSAAAFPDPVQCDYNELFRLDGFRVEGIYVASKYVIEQLYLNRPQLLRERRIVAAHNQYRELSERIKTLIEALTSCPSVATEDWKTAIECLTKLKDCSETLTSVYTANPYELSEIRRPKSSRH